MLGYKPSVTSSLACQWQCRCDKRRGASPLTRITSPLCERWKVDVKGGRHLLLLST